MSIELVREAIRDVKDFPTDGVVFKDISPVLQSRDLFKFVVDEIAERYMDLNLHSIVAIDARGFIFGGALAYNCGCGVSIVRKKGKLPWETHSASYDLEYGSSELEIQVDAIQEGHNVMIIDDVLATGGTAKATADLVEKTGAMIIGIEFMIELTFLNGREKLQGYDVNSIISY
ncbi:adenine phosphoribosyltransferase [bacterium AH-315-E10]|nr:adenine phosphoribosyltransferase [bacterium AH-315-E10]